jgi:hypothetical protein
MTQEALKLALEALEGFYDYGYDRLECFEHITAIKEALAQTQEPVAIGDIRALKHRIHELEGEVIGYKRILDAQPEQEPVAHLWECLGRWSAYLVNNKTQAECAPPSWLVEAVKNATTPPQRTEPVCPECKAEVLYECVACSSNNYPPQRTWVGLTDEKRSQLVTLHHGWNEYGKAIEAELKQKNGYAEEKNT